MSDRPPALLHRARPESCLSDLILDRMIAGELEGTPQEKTAREHLAACVGCRTREQELGQQIARFPQEIFLESKVTQAARAAAQTARRTRSRRVAAFAASLAMAATLVVWWKVPPESGERIKGALALDLIVQHAGGATETVLPGSALSPGDAVRFRLSTTDPGFVIILGIDAAKQVTAYFPDGSEAAPIGKGRAQLLPRSVILDDTLGPERIVALLCYKAIPVESALSAGRRALERAGGDPTQIGDLATGCKQATFSIRKVQAQ